MNIYVDHRYNHINFDWASIEDLNKIINWCEENGQFTVYTTGVVYAREEDLTAFLLRWS